MARFFQPGKPFWGVVLMSLAWLPLVAGQEVVPPDDLVGLASKLRDGPFKPDQAALLVQGLLARHQGLAASWWLAEAEKQGAGSAQRALKKLRQPCRAQTRPKGAARKLGLALLRHMEEAAGQKNWKTAKHFLELLQTYLILTPDRTLARRMTRKGKKIQQAANFNNDYHGAQKAAAKGKALETSWRKLVGSKLDQALTAFETFGLARAFGPLFKVSRSLENVTHDKTHWKRLERLRTASKALKLPLARRLDLWVAGETKLRIYQNGKQLTAIKRAAGPYHKGPELKKALKELNWKALQVAVWPGDLVVVVPTNARGHVTHASAILALAARLDSQPLKPALWKVAYTKDPKKFDPDDLFDVRLGQLQETPADWKSPEDAPEDYKPPDHVVDFSKSGFPMLTAVHAALTRWFKQEKQEPAWMSSRKGEAVFVLGLPLKH